MPEATSILPWLGNIAQSLHWGNWWFLNCVYPTTTTDLGHIEQWHNNWLALLFGLVSWCPLWHPGPRLSFFQGGWFLYTSLSWIVQTNAMYLHSSFQAVVCLLVCVAVSLCLNNICCYPFNIFFTTVLWLVLPSCSRYFSHTLSLMGLKAGTQPPRPGERCEGYLSLPVLLHQMFSVSDLHRRVLCPSRHPWPLPLQRLVM